MTITQKQRERRRASLGASDVPAVFGKDPFRSAYDLWLDKTGRAPEDLDESRFTVNNALEPAILDLASKKLAQPVVKPTATLTHPGGVLLANLDGMVERFARGQPIVEAKSTCIQEGWGEPDTDQVPDRVLIQVQMQMLCAESKVAYIARLLGRYGFKFELYRVEFNAELAHTLLEGAEKFWNKHVLADVAPEVTATNLPSMDLLSGIDREDKVVRLPEDVVLAYHKANETRKAAEKAEDVAKATLVAALGDASQGATEGFVVKYGLVKTSKFSQKEFEAAHPDLFSAFKREGGYRRLDVRTAKEK